MGEQKTKTRGEFKKWTKQAWVRKVERCFQPRRISGDPKTDESKGGRRVERR